MTVASVPEDERFGLEANVSDDIRPRVAGDGGNRPLWIGLAAIAAIGLLLFLILNANRTSAIAPATRPRALDLSATGASPPPLYIPPEPLAVPTVAPPLVPRFPIAPALPRPPVTPQPAPAAFPNSPSMSPPFQPQPPAATPPSPAVPTSPALVIDTTLGDGNGASTPPASSPGGGGASPTFAEATRARATRLRNRATTVPQGTLIAAVLETALDSTRPGQTRALVARDVTGLVDGRVLIPRGSRLFGQYRADLAPGQNRAQIVWTRLVRPDGATIAIDSPASDRLGRAGVRGHVNSHFLRRLTGALLQTSLDVGSALATRSISNSSVIFALPNTVQSSTSQLIGPAPQPTLTVRQGTEIAVFVARDLDFTAVESAR